MSTMATVISSVLLTFQAKRSIIMSTRKAELSVQLRQNSSRKNQHKKRFPTSKFTMMPIATGLTKSEARAMEQTIITAYTLDTLVNMINSILPKKWSTFKSEFEQMSTLMQSWIDQE